MGNLVIQQNLKNPVWDDIRVNVNAIKLSGSRPPSWEDFKGGQVLGFEDQAVEGNEEIGYFTVQIPHNYKLGTDLEFHLHWVPEDATAGNVRWKFTHSLANIGAAFPGETTAAVDAATPEVADQHTYTDVVTVDGSGINNVSSMLVCSISRNSSHANDTYNGKMAYLIECDFHYQIDSMGSNSEAAKE